MSEGLLALDLTTPERDILVTGLVEWGGPVAMSDALAVAIGFDDAAEFRARKRDLLDALQGAGELSLRDWRRTLAAAEVNFASNVIGVGLEWTDFSLISDEETFAAMRSVQLKLALHPSRHQD
ncbi:hypothetical protein V1Y59_13685 [Gordonia sp. PKS22-38]|uniref:Uncharacterized protein n=1 Tax=Gordonia prachuapensis TaxID=3115651 RepID=A0ABU7MVH9_9ACTN|nr:hypothetical protein [Gordonia sp. PKS22-38]